MGYHTRRICDKEDSLSEYMLYGDNFLIDNKFIKGEDIGGIVVSTS